MHSESQRATASRDCREDHQVIANTLREVELAEAMGLDAAWLTERHLDGAVAYADPLVFGDKVLPRVLASCMQPK